MTQGFLKHRRREAGTLAQQVGMWRLNRMGRSLLAANLDMANAFASTNWESLDKAAVVFLRRRMYTLQGNALHGAQLVFQLVKVNFF